VTSVLTKGLSFIPTPHHIPLNTLKQQHSDFIRKIKIRDFFKDEPQIKVPNPNLPTLKIPSTWVPQPFQLSKSCLDLVKDLEDNFNSIINKHHPVSIFSDSQDLVVKEFLKDNLSKDLRLALRELGDGQDFIIKPADKGGAIVIMDLDEYKGEAYRQLNDPKYYTELTQPLQPITTIKIRTIVKNLLDKKYITFKQFGFLYPPEIIRPRLFYLLPKIHKDRGAWYSDKMPPGRPIVSNCGSESSNIAKYLDTFLIPLSNKHPSYIKNSFDFVNKIRHSPVEELDFLFTADISSLYTNMENVITLQAVRKQFMLNPNPSRPDAILLELLDLILNSNDFNFDDRIFKQVRGCSMGLNCSPSLANIFLIDFDLKAMEGFRIKPQMYFRYLDDIFGNFRGSLADFQDYQNYLNSLIPGITLTFTISQERVDFLDTTIFKFTSFNRCTLQTKVFFKETDSHQLLHTESHHPNHIFNSILYSQILRFKRLSSFKFDFDETCQILFSYLKERGYSRYKFNLTKRKVWFQPWSNLFSKDKSEDSNDLLPFVVEFGVIGRELSHIQRATLSKHPLTKNVKILTAYKTQNNLCKKLVRAKL